LHATSACAVENLPSDSTRDPSNKRLRADTAPFLRHVGAHIDYVPAAANRGTLELGYPEQTAEDLVIYIRAHASDFIEWSR
jgi:hypothetical protein